MSSQSSWPSLFYTFLIRWFIRDDRRKWSEFAFSYLEVFSFVQHTTRTHDQSSFRAFPSVCTPLSLPTCRKLQLPACVDLHSKRATRLRGTSIRRNADVAVKGRNVAGIAEAFVVENRSTFYVPTYLRKEEGARSRVSSGLSIPRKSTRPGQKGSPAMGGGES